MCPSVLELLRLGKPAPLDPSLLHSAIQCSYLSYMLPSVVIELPRCTSLRHLLIPKHPDSQASSSYLYRLYQNGRSTAVPNSPCCDRGAQKYLQPPSLSWIRSAS